MAANQPGNRESTLSASLPGRPRQFAACETTGSAAGKPSTHSPQKGPQHLSPDCSDGQSHPRHLLPFTTPYAIHHTLFHPSHPLFAARCIHFEHAIRSEAICRLDIPVENWNVKAVQVGEAFSYL